MRSCKPLSSSWKSSRRPLEVFAQTPWLLKDVQTLRKPPRTSLGTFSFKPSPSKRLDIRWIEKLLHDLLCSVGGGRDGRQWIGEAATPNGHTPAALVEKCSDHRRGPENASLSPGRGLSLLEWHTHVHPTLASRQSKQAPISAWRIDLLPFHLFLSEKKKKDSVANGAPDLWKTDLHACLLACWPPSFCSCLHHPPPTAHLSIITSLAGRKLAHPSFWLRPQPSHLSQRSGGQVGGPSVLRRLTVCSDGPCCTPASACVCVRGCV